MSYGSHGTAGYYGLMDLMGFLGITFLFKDSSLSCHSYIFKCLSLYNSNEHFGLVRHPQGEYVSRYVDSSKTHLDSSPPVGRICVCLAIYFKENKISNKINASHRIRSNPNKDNCPQCFLASTTQEVLF